VKSLEAPGSISTWAHFVLFLSIAALATARPLSWNWIRLVTFALGLALITEGLQFFAIDRHPRWLDVGIDMSGAFVGMALVVLIPKITMYLSEKT
jgi:VanZ family protein